MPQKSGTSFGLEAGRIRVQQVIPVAKSKPHSSVSVKSVEVAVLAAKHPAQACVLGIDVAKFELMAVLRWADGSFQRPWRIVNLGEVGLLVEFCRVHIANRLATSLNAPAIATEFSNWECLAGNGMVRDAAPTKTGTFPRFQAKSGASPAASALGLRVLLAVKT